MRKRTICVEDVESGIGEPPWGLDEVTREYVMNYRRSIARWRCERVNAAYQRLHRRWHRGTPYDLYVAMEACDDKVDITSRKLPDRVFRRRVRAEAFVRWGAERVLGGESVKLEEDERERREETQEETEEVEQQRELEEVCVRSLKFRRHGVIYEMKGNEKLEEEIRNNNPLPNMVDSITGKVMMFPAMSPDGYVLDYLTWIKLIERGDKHPFGGVPVESKDELIRLTTCNFAEYKDRIVNVDLSALED